jgi:UDP-2,3-diacylglucosamine pyrophosphatase LpxH
LTINIKKSIRQSRNKKMRKNNIPIIVDFKSLVIDKLQVPSIQILLINNHLHQKKAKMQVTTSKTENNKRKMTISKERNRIKSILLSRIIQPLLI